MSCKINQRKQKSDKKYRFNQTRAYNIGKHSTQGMLQKTFFGKAFGVLADGGEGVA